MIGHDILTALLVARRSHFTTAAKIFSLALGLVAAIAAIGISSWLSSADQRFVPPDEQVVVLKSAVSAKDGSYAFDGEPWTPLALAPALKSAAPDIKAIARLRSRDDQVLEANGRRLVRTGAVADPDFLSIFHFPLIAGDPTTALARADGVVLTASVAQRLFGGDPALGRGVVLAGKPMVVTGVLAPLPQPSQFTSGLLAFDYVAAMPPPEPTLNPWGFSLTTYILLPKSASLSALDGAIAQLVAKGAGPDVRQHFDIHIVAIPAAKVPAMMLDHAAFDGKPGPMPLTSMILALGCIILGAAGLNYANLTAAQALGKTGETGMRRALGADGWSLLRQSWVEAALSTLAALSVAVLILALISPLIRAAAGIDLLAGLLADPAALGLAGLVTALTALAAGLYPALVMSRARPADALRAGRASGRQRFAGWTLTGAQFASASIILIAMIGVLQQNGHVRKLALAHGGDPVVLLPSEQQTKVSLAAWRARLAADPRIKGMSEVDSMPWGLDETEGLQRTEHGAVSMATMLRVGPAYFDTLGQKVLAGRVYSQDRDGMTQPGAGQQAPAERVIILDRILARQLGFASPQAAVGQLVYSSNPYRVIGVVEARPHSIGTVGESGTAYGFREGDAYNNPVVRLPASDVSGGQAALRQAWRDLGAAGEPQFQFEDQVFETAFETFKQIGRLFMTLVLVAFAIAATGLFGMAVHVSRQRLHEIGVRKTLGSSTGQVVRLLLGDFAKPVLAANLIAWPVGYLAVQAYLSGFSSRVDLGPAPFVLSLIITLGVACLAVGGQTWRAASIRPAQVLRDA